MRFDILKHNILENKLDDSLLIIKYIDNTFIADQYINQISKIKKLNIRYISSLQQPTDNLFIDTQSYLDVYKVETFKPSFNNYNNISNTIILCKDVDSSVPESLVTLIPNPTQEHILSYMQHKCSGLGKNELTELYNMCKGNVYIIDNELNKFIGVTKAKQYDFFLKLKEENNYTSLTDKSIFDLIKAITTHNLSNIVFILNNVDNYGIDAIGLTTLLYTNLKNIINVQTNPHANPASLNISPKQFNAIKYYCNRYDTNQLVKMFDFILTIDKDIKNGRLDMSNSRLIDYIVCNLL